MSDPKLRITNCHTHTFTAADVPRRYPHLALAPFKRMPVLIRALGLGARL